MTGLAVVFALALAPSVRAEERGSGFVGGLQAGGSAFVGPAFGDGGLGFAVRPLVGYTFAPGTTFSLGGTYALWQSKYGTRWEFAVLPAFRRRFVSRQPLVRRRRGARL